MTVIIFVIKLPTQKPYSISFCACSITFNPPQSLSENYTIVLILEKRNLSSSWLIYSLSQHYFNGCQWIQTKTEYISNLLVEKSQGTGVIGQQVTALVMYSGNLSLIPRTHMKGGKRKPIPKSCPLVSTRFMPCIRTHTHTPIRN